MTLHPDVLTDLVALYHAGEASQASRSLLEAEATHNPQIAAALAAPSRAFAPLPIHPPPDERKVWRKVRLRYYAIAFAIAWTMALGFLVALIPLAGPSLGIEIVAGFVPLLALLLFAAGAIGTLFFLISALRRSQNS